LLLMEWWALIVRAFRPGSFRKEKNDGASGSTWRDLVFF